jgi:hypothetical protein
MYLYIAYVQEAKEVEAYNYALEILITKSELEEKNNLIEELRQKVDESKTECTYQLRSELTIEFTCWP